MHEPLVRLNLKADDATVWALAEFVKRSRFEQFRECAVDDDEAYRIRDGFTALEKALAEQGFAPL